MFSDHQTPIKTIPNHEPKHLYMAILECDSKMNSCVALKNKKSTTFG